jgi:hypothetical protein
MGDDRVRRRHGERFAPLRHSAQLHEFRPSLNRRLPSQAQMVQVGDGIEDARLREIMTRDRNSGRRSTAGADRAAQPVVAGIVAG